ncbi:MAG: Spy/CpxP family protein refolding chaperone [Candidatus Devosia phytovorans]|uniref:Spy/CpxP family protein refolding chaperone n=1 Tax=Candidatus Devosia phytovorans TaxID=3121372 RepID=A0AAJ6B073_9HYPH|nr:Spy/CpxP family protein refolding chaperone [Devosia sp.]WEK05390.1 MAG: Spy/CpxP family protein refolding chaperone [Devosia sp.]
MKTISKTAIVALLTATLGTTALVPVFAQEAAPKAPHSQQENNFRHHNQGPGAPGGPRGEGGFFSVERGAEAIEIALVRLSHRVDLTSEQQPLFDAFKTAAIAAAADFATATEGLRPTPPAEGEAPAALNLADRLDNAIALQTARLEALQSVQPAAKAFFDSLTEEQTAGLMPQRPEGGFPGFGKHGPRHPGGPEAPAAPEGTPAPADAPEAPPANG